MSLSSFTAQGKCTAGSVGPHMPPWRAAHLQEWEAVLAPGPHHCSTGQGCNDSEQQGHSGAWSALDTLMCTSKNITAYVLAQTQLAKGGTPTRVRACSDHGHANHSTHDGVGGGHGELRDGSREGVWRRLLGLLCHGAVGCSASNPPDAAAHLAAAASWPTASKRSVRTSK